MECYHGTGLDRQLKACVGGWERDLLGQSGMDVWVFIGFTLVFATIVVAGFWLERRRAEALRAEGIKLGLTLETSRNRDLGQQLRYLDRLNQGRGHVAFNVLRGTVSGESILACDFQYTTGSSNSKGSSKRTHCYRVYSLTLAREVPELIISPEGVFSKFAQVLGYDDIDFESAEFSRRFCVRSPDKRFAYDFCDPRMIEFLLSRPGLFVEVEGSRLATIHEGSMRPERLVSELGDLIEIRRRIPSHLAV